MFCRVTYQKYPIEDNDTPVKRITSNTEYPAYGLVGDQSYIFTVTTVSGDIESRPVTRVIKTRKFYLIGDISTILRIFFIKVNKVCRVNNQWKANGEKFYKTSALNYLQNCTCTKVARGGQWTCTPMG